MDNLLDVFDYTVIGLLSLVLVWAVVYILWVFLYFNFRFLKGVFNFLIKDIMLDRFTQFLIDNDCLLNFKRQVSDMSFLASVEPVDWILMTFDWDKTPEGGEFWEELNSKWYKEIMG